MRTAHLSFLFLQLFQALGGVHGAGFSSWKFEEASKNNEMHIAWNYTGATSDVSAELQLLREDKGMVCAVYLASLLREENADDGPAAASDEAARPYLNMTTAH